MLEEKGVSEATVTVDCYTSSFTLSPLQVGYCSAQDHSHQLSTQYQSLALMSGGGQSQLNF